MSQRYQSGFTIVEVVLFLAISGALAAALLTATTAAIQQQQYRDSVQSFASFLRGQYEKVVSVENDRQPSDECPLAGAINRAGRGQSDCIIVGRYIATIGADTADVDGSAYETHPIYARQIGDKWEYRLGDPDGNYQLSWSAKSKLPEQSAQRAHTAFVIYRDPDSGSLTIRSNNGRYNTETIGNFIAGRNLAGEFMESTRSEVCVYDNNWMIGRRQSVFLARYSGSADAITVGTAEAEGCLSA